MSERSDINRVLETWMSEGPSTMPDRVIDVVADRISLKRQRHPWRLPWRLHMTPQLKLIAAAAAVIVIVVVGWNLLPKFGGIGGPTQAPSPTPGPTGTPVATGPIDLPDGALSGGRYRIQPFGDAPSLSVVADIPAGWEGFPANGAITRPFPAGEGVLMAFMKADGLHSDPCHWDLDGTGAYNQPGDVVVGPTVDDLVSALKANTSYTSSTASPLTFGEFEGQELEIQVPLELDIATCDSDPGDPADGKYIVFSGKDAGFYAQGPGPGYRWHLFIVDVGGTRLITAVGYYDGVTPEADFTAARAIVGSFEFTP